MSRTSMLVTQTAATLLVLALLVVLGVGGPFAVLVAILGGGALRVLVLAPLLRSRSGADR